MSYQNYNVGRLPFLLQYAVELVRYRHLCWNLVGSDLRGRFRRSRLGILWAVIQPLAFSLLIAVVWRSLFKLESYWDYAVYVFSGMLVWEYFSASIITSLDALMNAEGYLRQARIPFFVFQLRVPLTGLATFSFGFVGLVIMLAVLGKFPLPGIHLLLIPAFAAVMLLFLTPLAIINSIIGAKYRDVRYIMTIALQALLFVSPVMLAREYLESPELWLLRFVNPMVPLLNLFRDPVMYGLLWDRLDIMVMLSWMGGLWIIALTAMSMTGRRIVFAL